jgi:RNA polymerase sigma factor (TIGR02999 family)
VAEDDERQETPSPAEVTRVLASVAQGAPEADTRLLQLVYAELKRLAAAKMAGQGVAHTLQPTALVHEAYMRLLGAPSGVPAFSDSSHFFTAAAAAMRSILVDHARRKQAAKRGGDAVRVTLHPDLAGERDELANVLSVHEALDGLRADHERIARVVELLFFAGLSVEEAAEVLGMSSRTVKRDWRFGRAWLLEAMGEE